MIERWAERLHLPPLLRQIGTFLVIGVGSTAIYLAVNTITIELFGWGRIWSASAAFVLSLVASYIGNVRWTFQSTMDHATLVRFLSVCGAGFVLNLLLVKIGALAGCPWYIGAGVAVCTVPIFNFIGHKFWTFRPSFSHPLGTDPGCIPPILHPDIQASHPITPDIHAQTKIPGMSAERDAFQKKEDASL